VTTSNRTWLRSLDRSCQAARETISAELDGEASQIESAAARRHRAECADCDQFARTVAETTAAVRSAVPLRPSRRPLALPARARTRSAMAAAFAAAMVLAGLLGAGVATQLAGSSRPAHPHAFLVANREPDRALVAREQMLIRRTLGRQSAQQKRDQRLG
jgi:hypothetical protein